MACFFSPPLCDSWEKCPLVSFIKSSAQIISNYPFFVLTAHTHTFTSNTNIKWKFNNVWKWDCNSKKEQMWESINVNQDNVVNGFSEQLRWQNYRLSNSSASHGVKFPDDTNVFPSIIDHFIQLISCCLWIHLECQTLMLSMCQWKWENTLFWMTEICTDHLNSIYL